MYCLGTLMLTPNSRIYNREEGLLQLRNAEKNGQEEAALYLMIIDVYDTDCIDDLINISQVAHDGPATDLGTLILRLGNIAVPLTISSRIASKPLPGAYPDRMCIMIHSG